MSVRNLCVALGVTLASWGVPGAYARVEAGSPDLVVTEFKATGAPAYKNGAWEIGFQVTVKNQGSTATDASFVNGVRVQSDWRWSGFMSGLSVGGQKSASGVVKIADPGKVMAGRTVDLRAVADAPIAAGDTSSDPQGRQSESNESNNERSLSVKLPSGIGGVAAAPTAGPAKKAAPTGTPGARSLPPARRP